jgi:ribosomal protein L14
MPSPANIILPRTEKSLIAKLSRIEAYLAYQIQRGSTLERVWGATCAESVVREARYSVQREDGAVIRYSRESGAVAIESTRYQGTFQHI